MRRYDPEKHHRRSIRLKGYDYRGPGAYYVAINAQNKACLFGEVVDGEMRLNDAGRMIFEEWDALPARFPTVQTNAFVVMPNHLHGIVVLGEGENEITPVRASLVGAQSRVPDRAITRVAPTDDDAPYDIDAPTLGDVVGAFKSLTTVAYVRGVKQNGWQPFARRLWQRNYYEHIVRDDDDLNRIRSYIADNPARWGEDSENPALQSDTYTDA